MKLAQAGYNESIVSESQDVCVTAMLAYYYFDQLFSGQSTFCFYSTYEQRNKGRK